MALLEVSLFLGASSPNNTAVRLAGAFRDVNLSIVRGKTDFFRDIK